MIKSNILQEPFLFWFDEYDDNLSYYSRIAVFGEPVIHRRYLSRGAENRQVLFINRQELFNINDAGRSLLFNLMILSDKLNK